MLTLVRMGRGMMMGVDHNKNLEWVGASAGFYPAAGRWQLPGRWGGSLFTGFS